MADKEVDLDSLKVRLLGLRASLDREVWTDILRASVAAIVVDMESQYIVDSTSTADELFGYIEGELVGKPLDVLLPSHLRPTHKENVKKFSDSPSNRTMGIGAALNIVGAKKVAVGKYEEIKLVISLRTKMIGEARCAVAIITERF